jgi:integrase
LLLIGGKKGDEGTAERGEQAVAELMKVNGGPKSVRAKIPARRRRNRRLSQMGVPEHVRRDILGHRSSSITGDYTHASPEEMERAMEAVVDYTQLSSKSSVKSRQNGIQRRSLQSAALF